MGLGALGRLGLFAFHGPVYHDPEMRTPAKPGLPQRHITWAFDGPGPRPSPARDAHNSQAKSPQPHPPLLFSTGRKQIRVRWGLGRLAIPGVSPRLLVLLRRPLKDRRPSGSATRAAAGRLPWPGITGVTVRRGPQGRWLDRAHSQSEGGSGRSGPVSYERARSGEARRPGRSTARALQMRGRPLPRNARRPNPIKANSRTGPEGPPPPDPNRRARSSPRRQIPRRASKPSECAKRARK
jgi:hypothetical protein